MEGIVIVSVHGQLGKDFLKRNMSRYIPAGTLTLLSSEPNIKALCSMQCKFNGSCKDLGHFSNMHRTINLNIHIFKTHFEITRYFYTAYFNVNILISFITCTCLTLGFLLTPFSFEKTTSQSGHAVKVRSGYICETTIRWAKLCELLFCYLTLFFSCVTMVSYKSKHSA